MSLCNVMISGTQWMVDREVSLCLGPIYYVFGVCLVLSRKKEGERPSFSAFFRRPFSFVDNSTLLWINQSSNDSCLSYLLHQIRGMASLILPRQIASEALRPIDLIRKKGFKKTLWKFVTYILDCETFYDCWKAGLWRQYTNISAHKCTILHHYFFRQI